MKNISQMQISEVCALELSCEEFGANFKEACFRFFHSVSLLPEAAALRMQIQFNREKPKVLAFSDAALSQQDYVWMFKPCAKVTEQPQAQIVPFGQMPAYRIVESDLPFSEAALNADDLPEAFCAMNAVLNVILPSEGGVSVTLQTADAIPLRLKMMLAHAFRGAKLEEWTEEASGSEKGLPKAVVSETIGALLCALGGCAELSSEEEECFVVPEDDEPETPIEVLDLYIRSYNCLRRAGITTVEKLRLMTEEELMQIRNLGKKQYEEICEKLKAYEAGQTPEAVPENGKSGREELDALIGLENVKAQVKRIAAFARMQKDMAAKGENAEPITLNMIFTGNPGTAKTTVARIMAKILFEVGILHKPQAVETGRADLIGQYEGQTAHKVQEVFRKAKGGLLFIDEAYSLIEHWDNAFGDEAINTIVQEMENNRADTVVVFAGYPKPMASFLARNPGLHSRVPFRIEFSDYSADEMLQIASLEADRRGFSVSAEAACKMSEIFASACTCSDNGNGRFCRNLIENAILSYAERVYGDAPNPSETDKTKSAQSDFVLQSADFADIRHPESPEKRPIGF